MRGEDEKGGGKVSTREGGDVCMCVCMYVWDETKGEKIRQNEDGEQKKPFFRKVGDWEGKGKD